MNHASKALLAGLVLTLASTFAASAGAAPPIDPRPEQPADGADADAIVGRWKLPDQELVVAVAKTRSGYEGTVVDSPKAPALVGKVFLRSITFEAGSFRGELYAPKREEYVPMTATRKGDTLEMHVGKGMMSKDLTWQKV
jgi:uncharacterized protein (DUF2147 family)